MRIQKYFNYKDWFAWFYWIFLFWIVTDIVKNWHTLERWKWGYWSIDLIPATIMLLFLYIISNEVWKYRTSKEIVELEKQIKTGGKQE